MKTKLFLICFGTLLGLACFAAGYPLIYAMYDKLHPGTQFETIDDLRAAIDIPAEGNSKDGKSLNLREVVQSNPSDNIIYTLKPNLNVTFVDVNVQTNSYGMRNSEIPIEKSPDSIRIALLGDSFAFGWGVDVDKIFAHILEERLNSFASGKRKIEVLNFGVPGYSTFQEVADFFEKGLQFKPDIVLVYFIDNDFDLPFFIRSIESNDLVHRWSRDNPVAAEKKTQMEKTLNPNRSLKDLADRAKTEGYSVYFAINPRPAWQDDRARLKILDKRKDIHELKLNNEFERVVSERNLQDDELHLKGDLHPSVLKHRILGDLLADSLIKDGALEIINSAY